MSRPPDVMPVVDRTTKRGLFCSHLCPFSSSDSLSECSNVSLCLTSSIAWTIILVACSQSVKLSTLLKGLSPLERLRLGTKPMHETTVSTKRPAEVRRARCTEGMSLIEAVIMRRFEGAEVRERRRSSFSESRTRTVQL